MSRPLRLALFLLGAAIFGYLVAQIGVGQLISDAETRIAADAERLEAESEQQRAGLMRLRDELARAIQETVAAGNTELDTYANERRRALHELSE